MVDQPVTRSDVRAATGGWWLLAGIGVLSVAVGIAIIAKPGDSLSTLAVIAGIFLLVDGLVELAASLLHGTQGRGMVALLGVLTAIVGVLLIRHPIAGVTAIALLIGIWLIAVGVVRFIAAFEVDEHRGWNIGVGVVELIAGIVIVSDPNIGFTTLALLVGIAFIVNGLGLFGLGWTMHTLRRDTATP
ncbi:MAG: HdeD family acid-resistance protein [Solirubrobacterales bacterium]